MSENRFDFVEIDGARFEVEIDETDLNNVPALNFETWKPVEYDVRRGLLTRSIKQPDNTYRFELQHDLTFPRREDVATARRIVRRIGAIQVEPETMGGRRLIDVLGLESGDAYDLFEFRRAPQRLRQYFVGRGYLETGIAVDRQIEGTTVRIQVRVDPGLPVAVEYEPTIVDPAVQRSITQAWSEADFDSVRRRRTLETIRHDLIDRGYLLAEVEIEVGETPFQKTVRVGIRPGPQFAAIEVANPD